MKFLSEVPVTFDNTIVLDAKVEEYILMAKQKENKWYIGAMTNWTARDSTIAFSFLNKGAEAELYKDGKAANLCATDYMFETTFANNANQELKYLPR